LLLPLVLLPPMMTDVTDQLLQTDYARRQCHCPCHVALLATHCCASLALILPAVCSASFVLYVGQCQDHIHSRIAICGASICQFCTHPLLGAWHYQNSVLSKFSAPPLSRIFLVRSSSRSNMQINDRLVCALHPVCSDFQLCLFSIVTTTAPRWRLSNIAASDLAS
jgi:hypothetical protein